MGIDFSLLSTELAVLRNENQRLQAENDLLKAALAGETQDSLFNRNQQLLAAVAQHEASLKTLLEAVLQQKHDLEIISEIVAEHGDSLDAQWRERFQHVKREAYLDGVTGIANRRYFDATFQIQIKQHQARAKTLSIILLDIDNFKKYNDCHGHPAGDACLRNVGELLGLCLPETEALAARYGGEEFVCLLPETGLTEAIAIAEQIRTVIGARTPVTVSCGVASTEATQASQLIQRADAALYRAKERGRNKVISAN